MKRILAILLCLCMTLAIVACNAGDTETSTESTTTAAPATSESATESETETGAEDVKTEADYKLGMGVVVSMDSSKTGNAQVDATVATVVTDADGKIVACRIDVAQNKMKVEGGAVVTDATYKTKMELGDAYGMAPAKIDNDGNGVTKEWYEQAKAFEAYVVGKTVAEVEAIKTQEAGGHQIAVDQALLDAGCSMQITDFIAAVAAACKDEQGMAFKAVADTFTLGVAATTAAADSKAASAEEDGLVAMYTDFAATVVVDGKIVAAVNDAIQPKITINAAGEIVAKEYKATKRNLKDEYGMAPAVNFGMDWNGDGKVLEWYLQSAEFSKHVVGKTAAEVEALATKTVEGHGYVISADDALLTAGCTIQITAIKAVVAQSVKNAR